MAPDDDGPARALRAADHGFDEEVFLRVAKAHLNGNGIQKRVGPAYGVLVHIGEDFQALVPVAAGQGQRHGEFYAVLTGSRYAHAARVFEDVAAQAHPDVPDVPAAFLLGARYGQSDGRRFRAAQGRFDVTLEQRNEMVAIHVFSFQSGRL